MFTIAQSLLKAEEGIRQLIKYGETHSQLLADLAFGIDVGLWYLSSDGMRCVATTHLSQIRTIVSNDRWEKAAIFACEPNLRAEWISVIAARLKALVEENNLEAVNQVRKALRSANIVVAQVMDKASLRSTSFEYLETQLLGWPAREKDAFPRLVNIISSTSHLIEGKVGKKITPLPDLDLTNPQSNWIEGRLILLPNIENPYHYPKTAILSGSYQPLITSSQAPAVSQEETIIKWVLARPWPFLLTQLVLMQEVWSAEQVSGNLSLVLEEEYIKKFTKPPQILVKVTLSDGREVMCGSLAELIWKVLDKLGVTLYYDSLSIGDIKRSLSLIIEQLLKAKVWRFTYQSWQKLATYAVDSRFSDSYYKIFGSKSFYQASSRLTYIMRRSCEELAYKQLNLTKPSIK